jgi:Na+/H+-dicarboxylate symporter
MSLTLRILLALLAGLAVGALIAARPDLQSPWLLSAAEQVGGLWVDALRMTIVPLVFGLVVTGICSAGDAASAGGVTGKALLLFAGLLLVAGLFAALAMPLLLTVWPVPEGAREAFRAGFGSVEPPPAIPPAAEWLRQIIPTNPVAAAAEGAMLPLIVFALVFGFAMTRLDSERRKSLTTLFDALVQTMLIVVHWVLILAPIGVFALALLVGARSGLAAAGGLFHYVVLISLACIGVTLLLYAGIALLSRVSVSAFARAAWPAQAVAFSTQSSLASLPAMVEGVRSQLRVPTATSNIVLPLAVSLFRITSPAANLGVALYLAHLYGIEVSLFALAGGVLVAAIVSLASVGLPSQVSFFSVVAPVCIAVGAPIEMLGLLLAVESIPDIFRTVGNVTGDVAVTGVVGAPRHIGASDEEEGLEARP